MLSCVAFKVESHVPHALRSAAVCPRSARLLQGEGSVNTALDDLRSYLGRTVGMRLEPGQACYAENRLAALMRAPEGASISRLLARLDPDGSGPLARELIEALTCRESWFFRDRTPFVDFAQRQAGILAARLAKMKTLRVWSAGCASGQEAYSLAICLRQLRALFLDWRVEIIGTDLSGSLIERARSGAFSHAEIQRGLPVRTLLAEVEQLPEPEGYPWRMRQHLREAVSFRAHNLLDDCQDLGMFDVIFCRNVLGSMHPAAQRTVIANITGQLAEGGFLVLGRTETPWSLAASFTACGEGQGIFERRQYPLSRAAKTSHLRLVVSH